MTARVKFQNTSSSDRQEQVLHIVTLDDGTTVEQWAKDPLDAIQRVQARKDLCNSTSPKTKSTT